MVQASSALEHLEDRPALAVGLVGAETPELRQATNGSSMP